MNRRGWERKRSWDRNWCLIIKKLLVFIFRGGVCFSGGFFNGADDIVSVLLERTMVYALVVFVYFSECHGIDFTGVRDFKPVVLVFPYAQKPYIVITDDTIKIDAETDIKISDIVSTAQKSFLGCKMLCLEIRNPQAYKFSWRFKADRIFHKKYQAFICPELIKEDQRAACLDWFNARYPG